MISYTYTMHSAFPMFFGAAGRIGEIADCYPDTVGTLKMGNRSAAMSDPLKVLTMGVRKGDAVTISVDGPSEVEMFDVLSNYFTDVM